MPDTSQGSPAPRVILDRENPWPGLATFDEESHNFFYGRSSELTQLVGLVQRTNVTLLYGRSGLGKSSLINAGLFFELRKEPREYFPVPVTLRFSTVQSQEISALDYLVQRVKEDISVALARKTHKKASKAAPFFCKFLVLNKLNFTKRTPLR